MRLSLCALGILVATAAFGTGAQAQSYPWCSIYDMPDAPTNCGFVSFEQCMTTIRGMGGFCMVNTQYQAVMPAMPPRRAHKHSAS